MALAAVVLLIWSRRDARHWFFADRIDLAERQVFLNEY